MVFRKIEREPTLLESLRERERINSNRLEYARSVVSDLERESSDIARSIVAISGAEIPDEVA